jgi:hypothetical protein
MAKLLMVKLELSSMNLFRRRMKELLPSERLQLSQCRHLQEAVISMGTQNQQKANKGAHCPRLPSALTAAEHKLEQLSGTACRHTPLLFRRVFLAQNAPSRSRAVECVRMPRRPRRGPSLQCESMMRYQCNFQTSAEFQEATH